MAAGEAVVELKSRAPGTRSVIKRTLRYKIAVRLIIICTLGCLTGYLFFASPYWLAGIWTAIATVGLFYSTVGYVDQSERKLTAFLQSLRQNDFSVTFPENSSSDDYDLHQAFNSLNDTFKNLRSEKESQHQLLQVIVEHAAVPLICFQEDDGNVFLVNDAAKSLFQVPFIQKIDSLWRVDRSLPEFLRDIRDGEKSSFRLVQKGRSVFLSVTSRHLVFRGNQLKLVALADVSSELIAREAEAWQKLLRVLTHEISNSAIPLSTLSSYIYELVEQAEAERRKLTEQERTDILDSLKTIDQRSRSLKEFVHNFKSVNQVPEPVMAIVPLGEILAEVTRLFDQEFQREQIKFLRTEHTTSSVHADRILTMQVLINLIKNAIEAMANFKEGKTLSMSVEREGASFVSVHISDTGCGIDADDLEQIFVPFYSTKKGGSGIGLSISQQIMQKQKGNITVRSVPGRGSVFTVSFASVA
jgi:signal transduction histidine kinase